MKAIFEKPLIIDGEKDCVVLVYSKYIIGNIKKEIADLIVEGIDQDLFNDSRFESLVKIKEVFAYKFEPGSDSHITFAMKNVTGVSYKTIDFKNPETTRQAEMSLQNQFGKLGFKRKQKKLYPVHSVLLSLIFIVIISVFEGQLLWDIFMEFVGYFFFIATIIISLVVGLFLLLKRILNPPYQIYATK